MVNDDNTTTVQTLPKLAADANGNFVICWADERNGDFDIYAQRFAADGTLLGTNFRADDDTTNSSQLDAGIAMASDGSFVICWRDQREDGQNYDIYYQRFNPGAIRSGINIKVNDNTSSSSQRSPAIAGNANGDFVIVWDDRRNGNADAYFQRFAPSGRIGANVRADTSSVISTADPDAAMADDGTIIITWYGILNGSNIYLQRIAPNNSFLGGNILVNDDNQNVPHQRPDIAVNSLGEYTIAWGDSRDGDNAIYGQRYDDIGLAIGANFRIDDDFTMLTSRSNPTLHYDSSDRLLIMWSDNRIGGPYAQRYGSNNAPLGANFPVPSDTANAGGRPSTVVFGDHILSTWIKLLPNTNFDVWANILDLNNPVGITDELNWSVSESIQLFANYPNPFNPTTTIGWQMANTSHVQLSIYNVRGQKVKTLFEGVKSAGFYDAIWDGTNLHGGLVGSGVYFYEIRSEEFISVRKLMLLR